MAPKKRKTGASRQIEIRYRHCPPELRADDVADGPDIRGHAAVFDQEAVIGGLFREKIAPGAFRKTIQEFDTRLLLQHNSQTPLARVKNETLTLREDGVGLPFEANLPNTSYGNDTRENLRTGLLDAMSFGFVVVRDDWPDVPEGQLPLRTLLEVALREISIVTWAAYGGTDVGLRQETEARSILDAHNASITPEITDEPEALSTPEEEPESGDVHSEAADWEIAGNHRQRAIAITLAEIGDTA